MINIPIYRAKKAASNEWVEGYYLPHMLWDDYHYIVEGFDEYTCGETNAIVNETRIDPSTLSIHFPHMLDKNNNKVFASLNENNKGESIVKTSYSNNEKFEIVRCS